MKTLIICLLALTVSINAHAYEVKAKATSFTLCVEGKCETSKNNDEVIYEVDEENSIVTRKAVINASIKDPAMGGGLQSDNTIYKIIYNDETIFAKGKNETAYQRIIKAIGQTGRIDGYETIVIGEDFVITSRSTLNYFVIYQYKRIK